MADVKEIFKKIGEYITSALEFLLSDDDKDGIPLVVEWAAMDVKIVGMINPLDLTDSEKQLAARVLTDFGKHVTVEELERMVEIKRTGAMDNLQNATLDAVVGDATARYMVEKHARRRKAGKTA